MPAALRRLAAFLLFFTIAVGPAGGFAQGLTANQNYYAPVDPGVIRSAEHNHLGQAVNKMKQELRQGRYPYDGAYADLRYILDYVPNHPRALSLAAELALRANKPEWVERYFDHAFTLYPNYGETHALYAAYLHKRGRVKDAVAEYEKALALGNDTADTHYNLGLAYLAQKQYEKANLHAQKAYQVGFPYPALREKLKQAGAWRPLPATDSAPPVPGKPDAPSDSK
jgi:tetratricopeptide (TPR) repeat protein